MLMQAVKLCLLEHKISVRVWKPSSSIDDTTLGESTLLGRKKEVQNLRDLKGISILGLSLELHLCATAKAPNGRGIGVFEITSSSRHFVIMLSKAYGNYTCTPDHAGMNGVIWFETASDNNSLARTIVRAALESLTKLS